MSDGVSDHYFVSWKAGDIGFAYADAGGALLSGPEFIRTDGEGDNGSIQAQPVAGSLGARVLVVYEHGATSQLRTFETTEAGGYVPTDNDADSLDDLQELRIVDADPADLITTILEVHAGDDFDGDGFSNGAELTAMTDPVDTDSFPGEVVQIVAGNAAASELGSTGTVYVLRSGDPGGTLTVHYSIAGTAVNGSDYETILSSIELGDGENFAEIAIAPMADSEAEGDETVELTLLPDAAYGLGAETSAVVTITDRPSDQWRFERFTPAQLSDAMIGGYGADSEFDSLSVLLEYAFDSDPLNSDTSDLPVVGLLEDSGTGETHLAMVYLRRKNDQELVYQVQLTSDLETWTDATSDDVEDATIVDNGDGTETVTVRKKDPVTTETRDFMRLRVQRVD